MVLQIRKLDFEAFAANPKRSTKDWRSVLAMSIEDMDIAIDIFGARNHKVLNQGDISR
jgi:hypothetical protein